MPRPPGQYLSGPSHYNAAESEMRWAKEAAEANNASPNMEQANYHLKRAEVNALLAAVALKAEIAIGSIANDPELVADWQQAIR